MAKPISRARLVFLPPKGEALQSLARGIYFDTLRPGLCLDLPSNAKVLEISELVHDIESSFLDACAVYNSLWSGMLRLAIVNQEIQVSEYDKKWAAIKSSLPPFWKDKEAEGRSAIKFGIDTGRVHQSRDLFQRAMLRLAESCVLSFSQFGKSLKELMAIDPANTKLATVFRLFDDQFGNVHHMRDSISHRESRAQQLGPKNGRSPIDYQASRLRNRFETDAYDRGLDETKYIVTIADGSVGSLELNPQSLLHLEECLRGLFSSYDWSGPSCPLEYANFVD
ncbi:MAG: hypothetical protein ACT4OK_03655 [Gemmobacter sp.]